MLKLIRLEWKKNRIGRYTQNAVILAFLLALFLFALAYLGIADDPDTGLPDTAPGHDGISSPIELFTSMSFLVFTGVMLSSFIVSAYKKGTMALMFSYPIRRQKLLAAQMLAVWIFNFLALTLTKLFLYGCILAGSRILTSSFPLDFHMGSPDFYIQLIFKSVTTVTMGFIALFAGMKMKSSRATVVASFLLILLTQANIGDLTLAGNALVPALLTAVSLVFALLSVCGAETRDLM